MTRLRAAVAAARATIYVRVLVRQKRWLVAAFVLTGILVVVSVQTVLTIKSVFDDAIIDRSLPIGEPVHDLYVLAVLAFASGLALRLVGARIIYQLEYDLRTWLYDELQTVDPVRLDRLSAGQLVTRSLTDLSHLEGLTAVLPGLLIGTILITALAVVMLAIDPAMGLLSIAAVPVNVVIISRVAARLRAMSWMSLHRRAEVTAGIDESIRGIRVVKAFAHEPSARALVEARSLIGLRGRHRPGPGPGAVRDPDQGHPGAVHRSRHLSRGDRHRPR